MRQSMPQFLQETIKLINVTCKKLSGDWRSCQKCTAAAELPSCKLAGSWENYKSIIFRRASQHIQIYPDHLTESLAALKSRAAACQLEEEICLDLISTAGKIQDLNNNLRLNCIRLY